MFEDDNDSNGDGVLDGDQQGVATLVVGNPTSRATGSSTIVGSASPTRHSGFLRFLVGCLF